jgi:predicted metal-dependent phosphoesterase TrpH
MSDRVVSREAQDGAPVPGGPLPTADFHAHTTRSDGVLEPSELVRQAAEAGIRLFAIADHDNLAAFRELTAPGSPPLPEGVSLVPAVEINAVTHGLRLELSEDELHVLGIGVDPLDAAFEVALSAQRAARRERFFATVARLREIGRPVDAQVARLDLSGDDALGRPTLARALVAAGFAQSVEEAFQSTLGQGRPGYIPRTGLGPIEAIRAIRAAGGLAALAHFAEAPTRVPLLRDLVHAGLNGLESHHRSFDDATRAAVSAVARRLGLVETGGTDYHGDVGPYADSLARLVLPDTIVAGVRAALDPARIAPAASAA